MACDKHKDRNNYACDGDHSKMLDLGKYSISGMPVKIGQINGINTITIGIKPIHATAKVTAKYNAVKTPAVIRSLISNFLSIIILLQI